MVFKSKYPPTDIPSKDILSYVFDDWKHGWDRPLFIDAEDPSQLLTAAQLVGLTKRLGRGLREGAGIRTGDVVLMCSSNRLITPALLFGILGAGAIISGVNPACTDAGMCPFFCLQLSYQLEDSGARALFVVEETLELCMRCWKALGLPASNVFLMTLQKGPVCGVRTFGDLLEYGEMDWERLTTEEHMRERVAALNYSSGTTGLSKGCAISVFNIVAHCAQIQQVRQHGINTLRERGEDVPDSDIAIAYAPFYHALGQQTYCFVGAKSGDTTYIMSTFNLDKLLRYVPAYRISALGCVPPIVVALAKHPLVPHTDFSSVRSVICGAAPLGADTQRQAERALDRTGRLRIQQAWGMSESVLAVTLFAAHEVDPDVSGVGYILPSMEAKIVDDDGRELGYDEPGEVLLKGPNVFKGYWKKEKETRGAFTNDGWYRTGDIGLMKRTDILHIVDRKKELIKVKGYQVAPAELENLLLKNPDVLDVAVIGLPGEGTERPRAYVVSSRPGVDPRSISNFVASRLAHYKHLTGGVVFVESIPKNPSGKILRRKLRELAKREGDIRGAASKAKL